MKKILRITPVIVIMNISVLLLVYFGYGEAKRAYWGFKMDKLITQSRIVRDLMDDFLKIGQPLSLIKDFLEKKSTLGKFAGFSVFLDDDDNRSQKDLSVMVLSSSGQIIFSNPKHHDQKAHPSTFQFMGDIDVGHRFDYRHIFIRNQQYAVNEADAYYQVVLPLRDKFTQVGNLVVTLPKAPIQHFLSVKFADVVYATIGVCFLLVIFIAIIDRPQARPHDKAWLGFGYGVASLVTAALIVATLISIYAHGADDKIRMLSKSLANRLDAIVESGVAFESVSGLDTLLYDYQNLDPDIHTVALSDNGMVIIHPNPKMLGRTWKVPQGQNEYIYPIKNSTASVVVTMEQSIIRQKVLLAVKNLATLMAACCFIGFLTYNIGAKLREIPVRAGSNERLRGNTEPGSKGLYETMMPVWFLIVFAESLNLSFLPRYLNDICASYQMTHMSSSLLFSAFFIGFALILVPAGYLSDRWSDKYLIMAGILSFAVTMGLMGMTQHYAAVLSIRCLAGAAQGTVFIGVQNYIRKISHNGKMSQGGAVIVFSFNGGIISGSAIGSILLADIGARGIFFSAAAISVAVLGFVLLYVSDPLAPERRAIQPQKKDLVPTIAAKAHTMMKDGEFVRTLLFVGAASKVTFTGITIYAVPLLMNRLSYAQEDIGTAIMVYACAVLVSNYYISKWVDQSGHIHMALFCGVLVSSIGITIIALAEWEDFIAWFPYSLALLIFGGMFLLGVANGAISSPVVSHIMKTRTCRTLGQGAGVGAYRLFERMGHVAGPLIIGQLFMWYNQRMHAILLFGLVIGVFGIVFLIASNRKQGIENHFNQLPVN